MSNHSRDTGPIEILFRLVHNFLYFSFLSSIDAVFAVSLIFMLSGPFLSIQKANHDRIKKSLLASKFLFSIFHR